MLDIIEKLREEIKLIVKEINNEPSCKKFNECKSHNKSKSHKEKNCICDDKKLIFACCPEFKFEKRLCKKLGGTRQYNIKLNQYRWNNLNELLSNKNNINPERNDKLHIDLCLEDNIYIEIKKIFTSFIAISKKEKNIEDRINTEWGKSPIYKFKQSLLLVAKDEGELWLDISRLLNFKKEKEGSCYLVGFTAFKITPDRFRNKLISVLDFFKKYIRNNDNPYCGYVFSQLDRKRRPEKPIFSFCPLETFDYEIIDVYPNIETSSKYCGYIVKIDE